MATQLIIFPIPPLPLPIGIHLVSGNQHDHTAMTERAKRLKQLQGPVHICTPSAQRILVTLVYQRLRRQVNNYLRLRKIHCHLDSHGVTDISNEMAWSKPLLQIQSCKQRLGRSRHRLGLKPQTEDLSTKFNKPQRKPAALKAGMTSN